MLDIPAFTAEENLTRVSMDSDTPYLMVEGEFDIPIYCEIVDLLRHKYDLITDPVVVYGGGKRSILEWIVREDPKNVSIILDMDFDDPDLELKAERVTPLRRYSIENYLFEDSVVVPLISHLLNKSSADISAAFTISALREHWGGILSDLLHVLFYYQKVFDGDKQAWSQRFINQDSGDWHLSQERVDQFREDLLLELEVDQETCTHFFNRVFRAGTCPSINFPGKILMESFHRYLKHNCNSCKPGSYSPVTSQKSLITQLSSRLIHNVELEAIVLSAIN